MKKKFKLKPLVSAILLSTAASSTSFAMSVDQFQPSHQQIKQAINSNQLILSVGIFDPKVDSMRLHANGDAAVSSNDYGIVQFKQGKANFKWLESQGFKVIQSLTNNAYLVNWKNNDRNSLSANNNIRWFGPYQSNYKISPRLWQNVRASQTAYDLSVKFFEDYPNDKLKILIKKFIPEANFIRSNIPGSENRIAISISSIDFDKKLNKLATAEGVQWINFYYPEKFQNTQAVPAVQAISGSISNTPIFDENIFGTGQIIGVADSGMDHNEDWFAHYDNGSGVNTAITAAEDTLPPVLGSMNPDNKVVAYWVMPGAEEYDHTSANFHGTHTSGSVAGDRATCLGGNINCEPFETASASSPSSAGYDDGDGMAPNAQILFQDLGSSGGLTGAGSSPMFEQAYNAGVRIHSNSYGSSSLGAYISSDQNVDRSLRSLDDMIIVISAGNDDGLNNTTGSPGNAKSAITVGALGHGNSTAVAGFSNRGLTDDGRLKPDVSATGSAIISAGGNTGNSSTIDDSPATRNLSGTSMSTPITAGASALMRQYFTDGFYPTGSANASDSLIPSGQLMKAMLINGASTDVGFNSKDTGWGRPWLDNTLHFDGDSKKFKFWDVTHENGLSTGESRTFEVDVLAGEEFRATLVWYDVPGPTGSGVTLVNNLDLVVTNPDDTYLGNNFASDESTPGGSADVINTVEQVRFISPTTGTYTIEVDAPNVPGDGTIGSDKQGYALVVSGALGSNTPVALGDPVNLVAVANGVSGSDLSWDSASGATKYEIYRTEGTCGTMDVGSMRFIGDSTTNSFNDDATIGGYEYAYQVRAFNSDFESNLSNCSDVTSLQACNIPPQFASESTAVANNVSNVCQININWDAALTSCPNDTDVSYKVYRSNTHNFVPGPGNLVTTTSPGENMFTDFAVSADNNYFYRVSALNGSNESGYSPELVSSPIGSSSDIEGNILDNSGVSDTNLLMNLETPWSISNDAASNGSLSYRSAPEGVTTYASNVCARAYSPSISIPVSPSGNATLAYQARYSIEADWDGVVVEVSTDGGNNWSDLPPVGGYPGDFSETGSPAINGCGYPASQGAFNGSTGGNFTAISHDLSAYHGQNIQVRWSFSSDPGTEGEGFFIDEVSYSNVHTPNVCIDSGDDLIFEDGFEAP